MQVTQERTTTMQSVVAKRSAEAWKALEEWRKKYGHKLKGWDVVAEIRKWREFRK